MKAHGSLGPFALSGGLPCRVEDRGATGLPGRAQIRVAAIPTLITFFWTCFAAQASSVLLRSPSPTPPELSPVKTYNGAVEASVTPIRPAPSLTIVLLADSIDPARLDGLKADLISHYNSTRGRSLRLVVVQNNAVRVVGPLLSRVRLESALKEVQLPAEGSGPAPTAAILDLLLANAGRLGSHWSHALLIGDLPSLDPAAVQYASAVLLDRFSTQQVQVSWLPVTAANDAWLPLFESSGGTIVHGTLSDGITTMEKTGTWSFLVQWAPAQPSAGFVVSPALLSDRQGNALLEAPDLAVTETTTLPTIEKFAALESQLTGLVALLNPPQLPEADARHILETLSAAFEVNPLDPVALGVATAFYEKANDFTSVAKYARSLIAVRPQDGAAYASLGHALFRSNNYDEAEAALQQASTLHIRSAQVAEDLARIHVGRKDDRGALPYLDEALRLDSKRQELWFEQARAVERLRDFHLSIESLEKGLALGGNHIPETTSLLRLYLASKQDAQALALTSRVMASLPPDPVVRSEFAGGLDELKQSGQALLAWKRVLEVQHDSEPAHYRIARLLLDSGDAAGAEKAASAGLGAAPRSARLYVVKAEALQKQGHRYSAREALQQGASAAPDPDLLAHFAAVEDTYGSGAGAYARLADSLGTASPQRLRALERGFAVSVRDDDLKHAASFAALLQSAGYAEFAQLLGNEARAESGAIVPGGLDALAFAAHANGRVSPERFFVDYARTLVDQKQDESNGRKSIVFEEVEKHFQSIATLEAMGRRDGDHVVITLSLDGKKMRHNTEKVLSVLGIKLRSAKGEVEIRRGEKKSQAKKQETASALALDEVGIQEALEAGKPYELEIRDEWAPVYPNEKYWREAFYAKDKDPAGLAGALLRMPKMAELYVGVSFLDRNVITELINSVPLRTLYEKYSRLLYLYAPAFALEAGHAVVPGGVKAEPVWAQLLGASPSNPGLFFGALLERDSGKLLRFFFVLSGLDPAHQAFFTASPDRTAKFYKLFANLEEMKHVSPGAIRDSPLSELFRSVPLDEEGHLDFPGSPELWTVAAGRGSSETHIAKLLKKVSKAAPPEVEDEVLLRLAQTRYHDKNSGRHTELENFLAVSHIDAHRPDPLDEEAALILAQRYSDYGGAYTYFMELTTLGASDFRQFFSAVDHIKVHPPVAANLQLGELNSLVEWICLMRRRQVFGDDTTAKLFRYVCQHFASAEDEADYASASFDSARAILGGCSQEKGQDTADDAVRRCLLGADAEQPSSLPAKQFQSVLDLQRAPHLVPLLSVYDAVKRLAGSPSRPAEISTIRESVGRLPSVDLPRQMHISGKEKEALARYSLAPANRLIDELGQKVSKRKVNPKTLEKLSRELLVELQPQIAAALAGTIYAYFLRPTDLVVSEDPLLLRKHRYFDFVGVLTGHEQTFSDSQFRPESRGAGSYFLGSFAEFALAAGATAAAGWKTGDEAASFAVAEIAALRSTIWEGLEEADQRLLGLRVTAAREWIFESARRPDAFRALAEETTGLLSLSRRADLLNSIAARNWQRAWDSVTLPDLFALGGRYLAHFKTDPWPSPVTAELRSVAAGNDGSRLNILGPLPYHALGCSHPHLLLDAPYEEYQQHFFPADLAERTAEFKLFLAFRADSVGVQPGALAKVAEPLAAKAFRSAQLTNMRDWRSLLAAYASVTAGDLKQALEQ